MWQFLLCITYADRETFSFSFSFFSPHCFSPLLFSPPLFNPSLPSLFFSSSFFNLFSYFSLPYYFHVPSNPSILVSISATVRCGRSCSSCRLTKRLSPTETKPPAKMSLSRTSGATSENLLLIHSVIPLKFGRMWGTSVRRVVP